MLYDKDIREPLFEYLENTYGKIRIIEEKTMGRSRADVVMVMEDHLCGIEIKSDADTYARLSRQTADYDQYYDRNIIVIGTSHAFQIHKHIPDYWGIITVEDVEGSADFYLLRTPKDNPGMKWEKKMEFLWKPELAQIQEKHSLPKYKDKSKRFVIGKILSKVPEEISEAELKKEISEILFERDYTKVEETLSNYRKGEIQKLLDHESDSERRLELIMQQAEKGRILSQRGFKKVNRRKARKSIK